MIPAYKNDKHYGALISAVPPFNIITFFLIPLFLRSDKGSVKRMNTRLTKITYAPVCFVNVLFFVSINLMLAPIAYLKTLLHKLLLTCRVNSCTNFCTFCFYFLLGLPMILISQFTDVYYFMKLCFAWDL